MFKVLIIGAGGIGSQLIDLFIPALNAGDIDRKIGGVQIHIMDDDKVEPSNIVHQKHEPRMIGRLKVDSLTERLAPYTSPNLSLKAIPEKLLDKSQLNGFDLVVVAVDRPGARLIVHKNARKWLDLRCSGDGYMAMDSDMESKLVNKMTPLDQEPASCQYPSAINAGNVQFGFSLAATHGSQWLIQNLREKMGEQFRPTPGRIFSLTFGELHFPEIQTIIVGGDE